MINSSYETMIEGFSTIKNKITIKKAYCPECLKLTIVKKLDGKQPKKNSECFCSFCYRVFIYDGKNKQLLFRTIK